MADVIFFPHGVFAAAAPEETAPDYQQLFYAQEVLLVRWAALAQEIKRRLGPVPIDIALELSDLLNDTAVP
jgi:hypothetical protein